MAQYYNDHYHPQPPQPQPGHPDPYNPRHATATGTPTAASHDQLSQTHGYNFGPTIPQNISHAAAGVNQEMFMASGASPAQPYSYPHQAYSPQYAVPPTPTSYNPQDYAASMSPAVSPPTVGVTRMPSFPAPDPRPYNPADYAETNLQRTATSASRASYYPSATSSYGPPLPSPSIYQSNTSSRPTSMYTSRPQVQTQFSPRQSHYASLMPPPLPAIPGSAESPRDDWRHAPTRYDTSSSRYGSDGMALSPSQPSPGMYNSNRSSTGPYGATPNYGQSQVSSPGPTPPPHSSSSAQTYAEPRLGNRPLPRVPSDSSGPVDYFADGLANGMQSPDEGLVQQDLEDQIMNLTTNDRHTYNNAHNPYPEEEDDDDDDDPEAMAGLAAMREAELQDEAEQRRQSGGAFTYQSPALRPPPTRQDEDNDSDSDNVPVDIASFGGGFDVHISYGGDPNALTVARTNSQHDPYPTSQTVSSSGSMRMPNNNGYHNGTGGYDPSQSPDMRQARVDAYGTGGLADPSATRRPRRLSYDEGDEGPLMDYSTLAPGEPADMAFYPSAPASRPLPPEPSNEMLSPSATPYPTDFVQSHHIQFPPAQPYSPNALNAPQPPVMPGVPRHLSEKRFGTLPAAIAPARAKTDADDNRRRQQRPYSVMSEVASSTNGSAAVTLDLPSLTRKFNPQKLSPRDFNRCTEPWAVSSIISWLRLIIEGDQFLKRSQLLEALVALFTHKIATMHIAVAEVLADKLLQDMEAGGALHYEEEWLFFSDNDMSGVLYHLTGAGCYSSRIHDHESYTRCYAPHCQRTERKIDLSAQPAMGDADWKGYYINAGLLTEDQFSKLDRQEVARQNVYHEIIQKEESYLTELDVLITVYRDPLANADPPVIPPKKLQGFVWEIFGKVDAVRKANEGHLLPQMKYRQKEEGPFITGFSDILREWVRKARPAYIDYASQFPQAQFKVRQELEKNMLFRSFMDKCQADPRSKRLDWTHFLKLPVSRLQHFNLLLKTAAGKSEESEETRNLRLAISEVESLLDECDARVGDGTRKVDLSDLQNKLKLRPGMQRVDLNLDHLGREVLFQGDLLRIGGSRFTWLETHAILFDHYLVLAKAIYMKGPDGLVKSEEYDVSRLPIPMDLLVLDTRDDDPVVRTTLGGRAGVTKVAPNAEHIRLQRQLPNGQIAPELRQSSTSTSLQSLNRTSSAQSPGPQPLNGADAKEDKTLYPFRLKHLGKQTYTLYSSSYQNREDWCDKIEQAKTKHAAALFTQNAEPFKLRVMADSAFAYDGQITGQKSIVVKGTPLDRAIRDVEKKYAHTGRPGPVCRAKINCATAFFLSPGKQMIAVGTDFGVYISDVDDPRGWQRVIQSPKVTQISVLEEFSVLLLLSDKSLIAYHLDQVCPANGVAPQNDNVRRAPQKLSGSRDVGFFATGRMKDRTLVFYKKRDGIHSTFKVLEPVFQKSSEKRSRFNQLRHGKTEFFRDFDEFYIPTECMGMNMFHSSLAISTQKGFEILTLDKKQPISIPDLEQSHVQMIASRLAGQKPLGMFRLSEQEFLLCYEECAVYVNKHGDISRSVIMEFVGKARAAALYGPYVLLFDPDFVEIRNAQNGRLRQVIAGRDVRCLDDAVVGGAAGFVSEGSRTVKIALQHPAVEKLMVVLELLLNEGTRE